MVLITLDMGCSSSSCFVLNCYFDVIEFVVFHGLAICTVDMGCCSGLCFVLHCCYFDVFDFVDVFGLSTCTLNMGCFSCLCFVLNCYFDVIEFVVFNGLAICTVDMGCCSGLCFALHCCYFDVFDIVDVFGLTTCTLNIGCFSCLCFVLNCCLDVFGFFFRGLRTKFCRCGICFDVYEFVHFCGLDSCTLDMGCCVLNCYFDNVEFDYYVYYLSFQSRSCQHLLSTNPFIVDLTIDGDVEANPGPRKRRSNFESTPPSKIIRNAIFDQQTSMRKLKKQQNALNREICIENTMLNIENRQILTKKPLKPNKVKKIEPRRSGFKPGPLIQFKSMTSNQHLPIVMCFDLETYQDGHLYQNHDVQFLPPDEIINKKRKEGANLLKKKTDEQMGEWISDQKVFLISIVIGKFDRHNFFLESKYSLLLRMSP
ncbi:hypothetical protein P9112_013559 [Eukaryota sp. TZLM1-RC]